MDFSDYKKARLGGKFVKRVRIPDTDLEVGLVVLSTNELLEAESEKIEYLKTKKLEESGNADVLANNMFVLFRSVVDPDTKEKFFKSPKEVGEFTGEHLNFLADQYVQLSDTVNPVSKPLTEADIDELKKKLSSGELPTGLGYSHLLQALMVLGASQSTMTSEVESSSEMTSDN